MISTKNLSVFLNDIFVGTLTQFHDGRTLFVFAESYLANQQRPVLSLSYKNVLHDMQTIAQRPSIGLPPFFFHLLPEGSLRKYLTQKMDIKETQDFRLLTGLRDDLPGAVVLKPDLVPGFEAAAQGEKIWYQIPGDQPLRFSLAGVQMKFSGNMQDDRVVIPASGIGGHWIVKLPSLGYPNVVELENSMLLLASRIGIAVPEFKLVKTTDIENLPKDIADRMTGNCLISRRFDRTTDGGRIHMEDFAQVFSVLDKYDTKLNYQSIANVIWQEVGLDAVLEYVRRLVHMVVTGNADMHLKNWSLFYADGVHAQLAPAYDLVSTVVYKDISKTLPHSIAGMRDFRHVTLNTFRDLAKIAKLPERPVVNCVIETVDAIKISWQELRNDLLIPSSFTQSIEEHMKTVPLVHDRGLAP